MVKILFHLVAETVYDYRLQYVWLEMATSQWLVTIFGLVVISEVNEISVLLA